MVCIALFLGLPTVHKPPPSSLPLGTLSPSATSHPLYMYEVKMAQGMRLVVSEPDPLHAE